MQSQPSNPATESHADGAEARPASDGDAQRIVPEEEQCLKRVLDHCRNKASSPSDRKLVDYDQQLLDLRDEIASARMEDVPPLLEQMERLQGIAARQRQLTEGFVDQRSPYFGRLVLNENDKRREVLIGRSTYLDSKDGIRIVDWRDAPVSRLYYRYNEGDDYEETFGDRELEGFVETRRSLTIVDSRLRRIVSPQGTFIRRENGEWTRATESLRLRGGQGTATRANKHQKPTKLGVGVDTSEDKHLKEITALIDARQFELITSPDSGLVVIQGGAGSGKTTIGLHRLAYLAYNDARRFRADKMLVIVFNDALARYIAHVLPALDVHGVGVHTYESWAARLRQSLFPELPRAYSDETPGVVTRVKKHPAMLVAIEDYIDDLAEGIESRLRDAAGTELANDIAERWRKSRGAPLRHRVFRIQRAIADLKDRYPVKARHALERVCTNALEQAADVITAWSEVMTDKERLQRAFTRPAVEPVSERELGRAHEWCTARCNLAITHIEMEAEAAETADRRNKDALRDRDDEPEAVDGKQLEERAHLDREDDALLLRFSQRMRGPLVRAGRKEALVYEHVLVDEAQDLSPVELAVVMGTVSKAQSVTLAGDVAQRLYMNNGFTGWKDTLDELGLSHVQVEPLKLSYRSTAEIVDFSRGVLGDLAPEEGVRATRSGVPVELFRFAATGDAVGFLAEAMRDLMGAEPQASVAIIARYPEHADLYYEGLHKAETVGLRRIAEQDFPFKPGIDVTDVRQVKGLEFDYVILVEVGHATYGTDEESRHLLHIAATRASHQLWVLATGTPSMSLPEDLRQRSY